MSVEGVHVQDLADIDLVEGSLVDIGLEVGIDPVAHILLVVDHMPAGDIGAVVGCCNSLEPTLLCVCETESRCVRGRSGERR